MCKKKKLGPWIVLACVLAAGVHVVGCAQESFDNYKDFDTVVTAYDPEYADEFTSNATFAMPESVFDLSQFVDDPIEFKGEYEQELLDWVAQNMADLGYDRLEITGDPFEMQTEADVIVYIGAVAQENWTYGYYYNYWYGWYWYYPVSGVAINYDTGSVIMAMVDPDLVDEEDETVPVIWSAGLRGLLGYHSQSEVEALVDQAFKQSEYLRVGDPVPAKPGLGGPDAGLN